MEDDMDVQTPLELATSLLYYINHKDGDRWYEPFSGDGNIYKILPEPKDWAEIRDGRDFFTYLPFDGHCEHIISNPPFRISVGNKKINAFIPTLERSMMIATKTISFLVNHKILNTLTPTRLQKYHDMGWDITNITVFSVRKWFGRYWFVVFSRGETSIINWDVKNY